ncbi:PQQ-binding-like beta-propeller repeat protein [Haladaptatus sp. DFWS20]|uniref:outer membrane protein assembly factor BamB family protein n=1 Tax=Haladaptatus sp. DFWS20 TaxID=3403467 RepID=UPI003EC0BA23
MVNRRTFLQMIGGGAALGVSAKYTAPVLATDDTNENPISQDSIREDVDRTQIASTNGPRGPYVTTGWSANYGASELSGSPTISNGSVYIGRETDYVLRIGYITAFDEKTGALKWIRRHNPESNTRIGFPRHAPVVSGGRLFFSGSQHSEESERENYNYGGIYALDAQSGTIEWFREDIVRPPILDASDGRVYVGSHALDATTGQTIWTGELNEQLLGLVNGVVFTQSPETLSGDPTTHLIARDAADGTQLWRVPAPESWMDAAVTPNTLYLTSDDADGNRSYERGLFSRQTLSVYAYSATDGSKQWERTVRARGEGNRPYVSAPAVDDSHVYVSTRSSFSAFLDNADHPIDAAGTVYALDRETGAERWRFETPAHVDAAPTVAGDTVYVAARYYSCPGTPPSGSHPPQNIVYALETVTGKERWSSAVDAGAPGLSPTIANGKLYFAVSGATDIVSGWLGVLEPTDCQPSCEHQVADDGKTRTVQASNGC